MIVAWRIHHLTALGRETPAVPCTVYFTESKWTALTTFTTKTHTPPETPPCLNDAVRLLGQLGGHLGRNGDGQPGTAKARTCAPRGCGAGRWGSRKRPRGVSGRSPV